jgi:hypothetical protein
VGGDLSRRAVPGFVSCGLDLSATKTPAGSALPIVFYVATVLAQLDVSRVPAGLHVMATGLMSEFLRGLHRPGVHFYTESSDLELLA